VPAGAAADIRTALPTNRVPPCRCASRPQARRAPVSAGGFVRTKGFGRLRHPKGRHQARRAALRIVLSVRHKKECRGSGTRVACAAVQVPGVSLCSEVAGLAPEGRPPEGGRQRLGWVRLLYLRGGARDAKLRGAPSHLHLDVHQVQRWHSNSRCQHCAHRVSLPLTSIVRTA
jgi:hypothetical protein